MGTENNLNNPNRTFNITCQASATWSIYSKSWCRLLNRPPTNISLSSSSVPENRANFAFATLSASDPDASEVFTYTIIGGANASIFSISTNFLRIISAQNFELRLPDLQVQIRVSDKMGATFTRLFTITVTNVNEAPFNPQLSGQSVFENMPIATFIGNLTCMDHDAGDTQTWTLNNATSLFQINANELRTAVALNYEVLNVIYISVTIRDAAGLSANLIVPVTIHDANDPPKSIASTTTTVDEAISLGTVITTLQVSIKIVFLPIVGVLT